MKRRTITLLVAIVLAASGFSARSLAQDSVAALIAQLSSSDWQLRSAALNSLLTQPEAPQASAVQAALMTTLKLENQVIENQLRNGDRSVSEAYGEDYVEYYATLLDTVVDFVDFGVPSSVETLVRSSYNPDSEFAALLARHADVIGPALVDETRSEVPILRQSALSFAGHLLGIYRPANLPTNHRELLAQELVRGSQDVDLGISVAGKRGLQLMGDVNADGKTDCADITLIRQAFSKKKGQSGYDSRADVSQDSVVDIRDLSFVTQRLPAGARCQ